MLSFILLLPLVLGAPFKPGSGGYTPVTENTILNAYYISSISSQNLNNELVLVSLVISTCNELANCLCI